MVKEGGDTVVPRFPLLPQESSMWLLLVTGQTRTPRGIGVRIVCVWHFL